MISTWVKIIARDRHLHSGRGPQKASPLDVKNLAGHSLAAVSGVSRKTACQWDRAIAFGDMLSPHGRPAPPRRRFQFRLRTLMIVVTVACTWCGYNNLQSKIARERAALRISVLESNRRFIKLISPNRIGEERYRKILLSDSTPNKSVAELRSAFPEAEVFRETELDFLESK